MKVPKLDKTEIYNLLALIAMLILNGGNLLSLEIPDAIPVFGMPILLIMALAINTYSRSKVKDEAGLANATLDAHFMKSLRSAVEEWKAPPDYTPKVFALKKEMPGIQAGAKFQQSFQSPNVYFLAIAVSGSKPERDQVGIIRFEAQYVEDNLEWFERYSEQDAEDAKR